MLAELDGPKNLYYDLRFAIRSLRHNPGLTIVASLSLALGIGANTAIFSVVDALMLRVFTSSRSGRLVLLGEGRMSGVTDDFPHRNQELFSRPFYQEIQTRNDVFSEVAAVESMSGDVHARFSGADTELEPVKMQLVSGNYFTMLHVQAADWPHADARRRSDDWRRSRGGDALRILATTV